MTSKYPARLRAQKGFALIVLLSLLGFILVGVLLTIARGSAGATERARRTSEALAKAKEALIAYAVAVQPDTSAKRPGDLPCPDLNNDGQAELTCAATIQRIGRLPWKTLGLSDLRDGDGERLWYALSANFLRSTVNQCPTVGAPGCLNSETVGTITVHDPVGTVVNDGTDPVNGTNPPSGAVAVVFAPGPIITRLGGSTQDRSCAGDTNIPGCEQSSICSGPAYTSTARCNPVNYLDIAGPPALSVPLATASTEDNADFADGTTNNGFIAGPIRDTSDNTVVNDALIVVRYPDLIPRLEQRVAREALKCLRDYANANGGHYPWAAPVSADYTAPLADQDSTYSGRIPQTLSVTATYALSAAWVAPCPADMVALQNRWWANWSNLVFYAIATPYAPNNPIPTCGTCLSVDPPSPSANKPVVVLVAGRPIGPQARGVGALESAYLEDANATGSMTSIFKQAVATTTFDDVAIFQ